MNPDFFVEFQLSVVEKKYSKQEMQDLLYEILPTIVSEDDILGVQLMPWYYPKRVEIQCANKAAVETLILNGLTIDSQHVELEEQGYGALRVTIQDVPMNVPNTRIQEWLAQYGEVIYLHDEMYTNRKKGKRTNWKVGARVAKLKLFSFDRTVPPRAFLSHKNRRFNISVHHIGQTDAYCRTCRDVAPKEHECSGDKGTHGKGRQRRCYECNSTDHVKRDCPKGKTCHTCKEIGHLSNNCPKNNLNFRENNEFPGLSAHARQPPVGMTPAPQTHSSGHKRTASALNSPEFLSQPHTPGVMTTEALVHPENDGFTFDRRQRKKMAKAVRRGSQRTSTPAASASPDDNIEVISTDTKVSPLKKKLKTGQMKIKSLWKKVVGADDDGEEDESAEEENQKGEDAEKPKEKSSGKKKAPGKKGQGKQTRLTRMNSASSKTSHVEVDVLQEVKNDEKTREKKVSSRDQSDKLAEKGKPKVPSQCSQCPKCHLDKHETLLYSIGASNFVEAKIEGDEDLSIDHRNYSHPGLNIQLTPSKFSSNTYEEERQVIPMIVTNVGSVDFQEDGGNDVENLYERYAQMVIQLKKLCPKANIIVSSIIPRKGEERFRQVNEEIAAVNAMLQDTCEQSNDVHFCDNTNVVFDDSNQVRNQLYEDYIHLNSVGRKELCKSIFKKVKEIYFENEMCKVCAQIVCASPQRVAEQSPRD